jgi:hypothetical protein
LKKKKQKNFFARDRAGGASTAWILDHITLFSAHDKLLWL